jgi:hypothetical protein
VGSSITKPNTEGIRREGKIFPWQIGGLSNGDRVVKPPVRRMTQRLRDLRGRQYTFMHRGSGSVLGPVGKLHHRTEQSSSR